MKQSAGGAFFTLSLDDKQFHAGMVRANQAIGQLSKVGRATQSFSALASAGQTAGGSVANVASNVTGLIGTLTLLGTGVTGIAKIIGGFAMGPLGLLAAVVGALTIALHRFATGLNEITTRGMADEIDDMRIAVEETLRADEERAKVLEKQAAEIEKANMLYKEQEELSERIAEEQVKAVEDLKRKQAAAREEAVSRNNQEFERAMQRAIELGEEEAKQREEIVRRAKEAKEQFETPEESFERQRKELRILRGEVQKLVGELPEAAIENVHDDIDEAMRRLEREAAKQKPQLKMPSLDAILGGRLAEQVIGPGSVDKQQLEVGKKQLRELNAINKRLGKATVVP